jgi:hypothetical protein
MVAPGSLMIFLIVTHWTALIVNHFIDHKTCLASGSLAGGAPHTITFNFKFAAPMDADRHEEVVVAALINGWSALALMRRMDTF